MIMAVDNGVKWFFLLSLCVLQFNPGEGAHSTCPDGQFSLYTGSGGDGSGNGDDNGDTVECVAECPCGYIGQTNTGECEATFFEQSIYEAAVPINLAIGSTVLTIPLYFDVVSTEETPLYLYTNVYSQDFRDEVPIGVDSYYAMINTSIDCQGRNVLTHSVQIIMQSSPVAAGIHTYGIYVDAYSNDDYFYAYATITLQVEDVCGAGEYYLHGTAADCVTECPCGFILYPDACKEVTTAIEFIPSQDQFQVFPNITSGSKVGTTHFMVESKAYQQDPNINIYVYIFYNEIGENEYYPDAQFNVTIDEDIVTMCTTEEPNGTTYLTLQADIILDSPAISVIGTFDLIVDVYWIYYAYGFISVTIESGGCDSAEIFDFGTRACESECSCGSRLVRTSMAEFCSAFGAYDFHWSPFLFGLNEVTFSFPYKDRTKQSDYFRLYFPNDNDYNYFLDDDFEVIVEVEYVYSEYTTGIGSGIDVPNILLRQLDGTTAETFKYTIIIDESEMNADTCISPTSTKYTFIPLDIEVEFNSNQGVLANHTFVILARLYDPVTEEVIPYVQSQLNVTISVGPGIDGSVPGPAQCQPGLGSVYINLNEYDLDADVKHLDRVQNGVSDGININVVGGMPFGNSIQNLAYVSTNGFISFTNKYFSSYPSRFPLSTNAYLVAPFWSDNDIRQSGDVYYVSLNSANGNTKLFKDVNDFIDSHNVQSSPVNIEKFEGKWMLIAQWEQVHPFPHGSSNNYYTKYYGSYTQLENTYQAIIVTDGASTYAIFAYNCSEMQWSGIWNHAVVGYTDSGDYYENHPASGYDVVDTVVACQGQFCGFETTNLMYQLSQSTEFVTQQKQECMKMYSADKNEFGDFSDVQGSLEPCPCNLLQAWRDWGRFRSQRRNWRCFVQRTRSVNTQQCCYAPSGTAVFGSLVTGGLFGGSLLAYSPFNNFIGYQEKDVEFKEACCGVANLCELFYERRPPNNCEGYEPPVRTWGWGDPHITTLDERSYTFNGWGEYVLLEYVPEGATQPTFILQGRTTPVSNGSSATKYSAFALGLRNGSSVMISEVNGDFGVHLNQDDIASSLEVINSTYNDSTASVELTRESDDTILCVFSNGIGISVTISNGILNFVLVLPTVYMSRTRGLLGNYNGDSGDEFVPRGSSSPLSDELTDRQIHNQFAQTWSIEESESLFVYGASGSWSDYSRPNHEPIFADELTFTPEQLAMCGEDNLQCLYDLSQTGSEEIAMDTLSTDETNKQDQLISHNFPPTITGDKTLMVTVGIESSYSFTVVDPGDVFTVGAVEGLPNGAALEEGPNGLYTFTWTLAQVQDISLHFYAKDSLEAVSAISVQVYICACENSGNCTLNGVLSTGADSVVMRCECPLAYSGPFCEEDEDGCALFACYEGVECVDVPAPGTGASCGSCPQGNTGDGTKCLDVDECAEISPCDQECVNTDGSYECRCYSGYEVNEDGDCQDINECVGVNGCQQTCINTPGSYNCSCYDGFTLDGNGQSCTADAICPPNNDCSDICSFTGGVQECFCHLGYELESDNRTCRDQNECALFSPCEHACENTDGSFLCVCAEGYEITDDGRSCGDIDECLAAVLYRYTVCPEGADCVNTIGSFRCDCPMGYHIENNTCERDTPPTMQPTMEATTMETTTMETTTMETTTMETTTMETTTMETTTMETTTMETTTSEKPTTDYSDEGLANGVTVTLTTETFAEEVFKETTANAVNNYCSSSSAGCPYNRQGNAVEVMAENVIIASISVNDEGELEILVYVQVGNEVLEGKYLLLALEEGKEEFESAGFEGITFEGPTTTSPTTESATDLPPTLLIIFASVGGAVVVALSIILLLTIVLCALRCCQSKKKTSDKEVGKELLDMKPIFTD